MKSFLPLALLFFLSFAAGAQKIEDFSEMRVLKSAAYNKMITQDITYAISGEATPTSGIKIDITKPEATIAFSNRPKKDGIPWSFFTFELKAGVTDRSFNILKGFSSANSAFEAKPSFHFIPSWNGSKYGYNPEATRQKIIINALNTQEELLLKSVDDSLLVISHIRQIHLEPVLTMPYKGVPSVMPVLRTIPNSLKYKKIALHFLRKILGALPTGVDEHLSMTQILNTVPVVAIDTTKVPQKALSGYKNEINVLYKKYTILVENSEELHLNKMIVNSSEIWTQNNYTWLTVSPFVRTEKVMEYFDKYEQRDSSYFKSDYRFYYGISAYLNHYIVFPHKTAHLMRIGVNISHSNNLTTLTSFNYETRDSFFSYPSSTTEKTKTGTAYNNADIIDGFHKQLIAEYYLLPLKSLIPGIYVSANVNQGKIYNLINFVDRQNDEWQFGMEGGLVFNINSKEKDKERSILSILAFIRHQDLTDSRRTNLKTNIPETATEFRKRNISIGLRVGIPITLPERKK